MKNLLLSVFMFSTMGISDAYSFEIDAKEIGVCLISASDGSPVADLKLFYQPEGPKDTFYVYNGVDKNLALVTERKRSDVYPFEYSFRWFTKDFSYHINSTGKKDFSIFLGKNDRLTGRSLSTHNGQCKYYE